MHRGVHTLAERATAAYEASREKARAFINAKSTKEVLFTRGTTTGLNWVTHFADEVLEEDDEVIISIMEHHSNVVPWQEVCRKNGAHIVYVYLKDGALDMTDLRSKLSSKTKFVSIAHVSNVLGCVNPVKEIAELAPEVGAYMVVDGAQSAPHMTIDVQELNERAIAYEKFLKDYPNFPMNELIYANFNTTISKLINPQTNPMLKIRNKIIQWKILK